MARNWLCLLTLVIPERGPWPAMRQYPRLVAWIRVAAETADAM